MTNSKITRRDFLRGTTAAAVTLSLGCAGIGNRMSSGSGPPNIVMVLADDLGYGDLGCYGNRLHHTPHIDALAAEGIRLTSGYVTAAVCSPSRAGLMTGRHQQRHGYEYNLGGRSRFGLSLEERTLANLMKHAGYATGMIGKWHLGNAEKFSPLERGFDEFYGITEGGTTYATPRTPDIVSIPAGKPPERGGQWAIRKGRETVVEDTYITDAFTREGVDFIRRHRDEPFFLYLSYTSPHTPLQAKGSDVKRNSDIDGLLGQVYAAMITALDDGVGRVTAALRESGLEENTLVIFFSDNGGALYVPVADNGPLNGGKRYQYEGGHRVPFIVKWPDRLPRGSVYDAPVVSLDLYPTLASAAGVEGAMHRDHDGVDVIPHLSDRIPGSPHERLFWRADPNRAIRQGKWKLWQVNNAPPGSKDMNHRRLPVDQIPADSPDGQQILLFDLSSDLGERMNVAEDHPEIVTELLSALDDWEAGLSDPTWRCVRSTIFERDGSPLQLFF